MAVFRPDDNQGTFDSVLLTLYRAKYSPTVTIIVLYL